MASAGNEFPVTHFDEYETEPIPLPRRRRLPLLTALLALAVVAGGAFIGGVEMQKHEGGATAGNGAAAAFASRFGRGGTQTGTTSTTSSAGGGSGAFGGATVGTVTAIKGSTLYVTDSSGNTVKVTTSAASAVTKTVSTNVKGINPGDTVVIRGTQASNGTITADSITVGGSGGAGLFGGGSGATGFGGGDSGGSGSSGNGNGGATGFGG